jgi:hypothetical protein
MGAENLNRRLRLWGVVSVHAHQTACTHHHTHHTSTITYGADSLFRRAAAEKKGPGMTASRLGHIHTISLKDLRMIEPSIRENQSATRLADRLTLVPKTLRPTISHETRINLPCIY